MNYWKLKHTVGSTAAARCGVYVTANARSLGGTACGYWSGKQVTSPPCLEEDQKQFPFTGGGKHYRFPVLPQSYTHGPTLYHNN